MTRMNVVISVFLAATLASTAGVASADIIVTVSDGTTTKSPANPLPRFKHKRPAPAGANHTLSVLDCATPPCVVHFPSGAATAQSGDTFKLMDISATNRVRIVKTDVNSGSPTAGPDSVTLRGLKLFSLTSNPRTFTLTYETQAGDLTPLPTTSYVAGSMLKGKFRTDLFPPIDGLSGSPPTTCNTLDLINPCVRLSVRLNVPGASTTSTLSVPCTTKTGSISPCGQGGFWDPVLLSGDNFSVLVNASVPCPTTCIAHWQSTLTVKSNAVNQVLTLSSSAATLRKGPSTSTRN